MEIGMEQVWTSCNCNDGMHVNHDDEAFPSTRLLPNEGGLEPSPLKCPQAGVHGCTRLGYRDSKVIEIHGAHGISRRRSNTTINIPKP